MKKIASQSLQRPYQTHDSYMGQPQPQPKCWDCADLTDSKLANRWLTTKQQKIIIKDL